MNRQQRRRAKAQERRQLRQQYQARRATDLHQLIVQDARRVFDRVFASGEGGVLVLERAACLYQAAAVIYAAHQHGVQLTVQAGSAAWPRMPLELDDGKIHTHFAYEWQGLQDARTQDRIRRGLMPEMHVWAAHVEGAALVDITTCHTAEQCRIQGGMEWTAAEPPDHLWATAQELPLGWFYSPAEDATRWVLPEVVDAIKKCGELLHGGAP